MASPAALRNSPPPLRRRTESETAVSSSPSFLPPLSTPGGRASQRPSGPQQQLREKELLQEQPRRRSEGDLRDTLPAVASPSCRSQVGSPGSCRACPSSGPRHAKGRRAPLPEIQRPPSRSASDGDVPGLYTPGPCISRHARGSGLTGRPETRGGRRRGPGLGKDAHFVPGSKTLNRKAGTDAFTPRVVRTDEMRSYRQAFEGIELEVDGTISYSEFRNHLHRQAPDLFPHADALYRSLCTRGTDRGPMGEGKLSFRTLVEALFPAAKEHDVNKLMSMAWSNDRPAGRPPSTYPNAMHSEEADEIFKYWNKSGTGVLTLRECIAGMEGTGMTEDEVETALDELFGEPGTSSRSRGRLTLAQFQAWLHDGML